MYAVLAAGALASTAGCQDPSTVPSSAPEEPAPGAAPLGALVAGAEHDVALIAERAVLGFRASGGAFAAGYQTHDVLVRGGAAELTPHHVTDDGARITGGAMTLETGYVRRGDGTDLGGAARAQLVDGAVEIRRGAATERIENREDGIEQAWRFDAAPAGAGDLVVGVSIGGEALAATTATGLHFTSPAGLGFRVSNATWIDASGAETDVPARFVDGHAVFTVPAEVVASTAWPAVLDPTVNAEIAVDSPVTGASGPGGVPAIAFDGTNYLVVFSDNRFSADADIFAARISQSGTALDAVSIPIAVAPGVQTNPSVAFAGGQYVVAWEDYQVAGGTSANIAAAAVSTDGTVAQLGAVAATAASETQPNVASNGANALVVWNSGGSQIDAAVIAGSSIGDPLAIASGTVQDPVAAGAPGGNYLVAWSSGSASAADLVGQLVTPAGALSGAAFPISNAAGRQYLPAATFDGANYALAWTQNSNGVNLYGGRVSPAGAVLDGAGGIAISTAAGNQQNPTIACPSSGCVVAWQDQRSMATNGYDIYAQLMTPAFGLAGANFAVSTLVQPQVRPALAAGGSDLLAVWQDRRDATSDAIYGTRISTVGGILDGVLGLWFGTGINRETSVALGRLGARHHVYWADTRNGATDVALVRFSATGSTKLDATALPISTAPLSQTTPAATQSTSGNLVVVWADTRNGLTKDIYGTRVDADGNALDAGGIAISTAAGDQFVPAVATTLDGSSTLVVWEDGRNGLATGYDIYGALLDRSGAIVANDIVICNAPGEQNRPAIAFDSKNQQFVVVWSDQRVAGDADVYAARVDTAGAVLDANGARITTAAKGQLQPDIAFSTANNVLLAVWEDRRNDSKGDVYGTRLTAGAALTVLDPGGLAIADALGSSQSGASVGSIGGSFLVAWTDDRNAILTGQDIWAAQVSTVGGVEPSFVVSANVEDESLPSVGDASTPYYTRIGYQKKRADLSTVRVATRFIRVNGGTGQTCGNDAQCNSGFCVDGYCCDAACGGTDTTDCQGCSNRITGLQNGVCAPAKVDYACRGYADTFCDLVERCDGTSTVCPDDVGRREGMSCSTGNGTVGVCPADDASGAPHVCQ